MLILNAYLNNKRSRHDYMAFGADISETLGNVGNRATAHGYGKADEIRKQYTGYEHDDESGLDFAQARYYNSSHGRFTSIDPLTASANVKDPQTFNRYMYAMNSPYKFTDPLGLISEETGGNWINSGGFTGGCSASASNCNYDDNNPGFASQNTPTPESHTNEAAEITSSDNGGNAQEAEPALSPPAPEVAPYELIAEALLNIANVKVVASGKPDIKGIMQTTPQITEAITFELNEAFLAGNKVGAAAKLAGDKIILVGGVTGEESSVGPSLTLTDLGIQGSQSKYAEKNYEKAAAGAIKMDLDELANNTGRATKVAGALQNIEVDVVTSNSTFKKLEIVKATADYGFWNSTVRREIDLIYRRGVRMGYDNTTATPSLGNVVPK